MLNSADNIHMTTRRLKEHAVFAGLLVLLSAMMPQVCAQTKEVSEEQAAKMRTTVIAQGRKHLGKPYRSGATGPNAFDCSGFVYTTFREGLGIQLQRSSSAMYSKTTKIKDSEREPGDLVFFSAGSSVTHVGIYLGNGRFIHCASEGPNTGVIESALSERYWKTHYTGAGRVISPSGGKVAEAAPSTGGPTGSGSGGASSGGSGASSAGKPISSSSGSGSSSSGKPISSSSGSDPSSGGKPAAGGSSSARAGSGNGSATASTSCADDPSESRSGGFLSGVLVDGDFCVGWSLFDASSLRLNLRGFSTGIHARCDTGEIQPGVGMELRADTGTGTFQIPILLSLTLGDYVRVFAGPVFSAGSAEIPGDGAEIEQSFFPGTLGVSFNTPPLKIGAFALSLVQDFRYTVFNRTDGSALGPLDSAASGITLSTGLRLTLPLKELL